MAHQVVPKVSVIQNGGIETEATSCWAILNNVQVMTETPLNHRLFFAFQQPKQGSRPGPSTGARPMPASQKVKQVQGQQRSRPSPPPAKKVSGPGGIVGEEDFEEDDVICID